jgi:hypothetical protein
LVSGDSKSQPGPSKGLAVPDGSVEVMEHSESEDEEAVDNYIMDEITDGQQDTEQTNDIETENLSELDEVVEYEYIDAEDT